MFQYTMTTLGRLLEPEQFAAMILKTDDGGSSCGCSDVANIELGALSLRPDLHAQRPAVGGAVAVSVSRLQRSGGRRAVKR